MHLHVMMIMSRHYMGEDLASMSLKELHSLEQQLDTSIKQIRTRKVIHQYLIIIYMTIY